MHANTRFWQSSRFDCSEAASDDRLQRVESSHWRAAVHSIVGAGQSRLNPTKQRRRYDFGECRPHGERLKRRSIEPFEDVRR